MATRYGSGRSGQTGIRCTLPERVVATMFLRKSLGRILKERLFVEPVEPAGTQSLRGTQESRSGQRDYLTGSRCTCCRICRVNTWLAACSPSIVRGLMTRTSYSTRRTRTADFRRVQERTVTDGCACDLTDELFKGPPLDATPASAGRRQLCLDTLQQADLSTNSFVRYSTLYVYKLPKSVIGSISR